MQFIINKEVEKVFLPNKIIMFGSYAYGYPTFDSDIDLIVLLSFNGDEIQKAIEIRKSIKHKFPLDLIVRKPEILQKRIELGDFFLMEIIQKGVVLFERAS